MVVTTIILVSISDHDKVNEHQLHTKTERMKSSPSCFSDIVLKVLRLLFQLALILIFLFFFGLPALKRYLAMEVMVVKTIRESGGKIAAPAISINARNLKTRLGWKGDDRELDKLKIDKCLKTNFTQTCIEYGTAVMRFSWMFKWATLNNCP